MSKARWKVWMAADDTLELLIYDVIGQTWDGEGCEREADREDA